MGAEFPAEPARCPGPQSYLPTPHEIARQCERIRAGWSPDEHRARANARFLGRMVRDVRREFEEVDPGLKK